MTRFLLSSLVIALSACGDKSNGGLLPPPAAYPFAYAVADCAPWDGPAVTIYLTARATDSTEFSWPQLRISVWRAVADLPGQTFSWPTEQQIGAAVRCADPDTCEPATAARVSFLSAADDTTLMGVAELTFAGATRVHGGFRAPWRRTRVMCG